MTKKGLNPVQKLLVELTGTTTPTKKLLVHLNFGPTEGGRTSSELSGPKGKCVLIRQRDDLEIQWGKDSYVFFNPTPARRSWRIVEEHRVD